MSPMPVLGLTMGDPAGIGPEICLRALRDKSVLAECVPVLFGDVGVLLRLAKAGFPANIATVVSVAEFNASAAPTTPVVVECGALDADKIEPGKVSAACGQAAYRYIEQSIRAALAKG